MYMQRVTLPCNFTKYKVFVWHKALICFVVCGMQMVNVVHV